MSDVTVKRYAIGAYNPDGTPKQTKRKRVVTKPYMTRKRKALQTKKSIRTTMLIMMLWILSSCGVAIIEAKNSYQMEFQSQPRVIEAVNTDYSGIPYMERVEVNDYTEDEWESVGTMTISHYSELDSCHYPTYKNGYRQCLAASGKIIKVGMVATNLYPFGTRLMIDGQIYIVEDRISEQYRNRIDIFVGYGEDSYKLAKELGIQQAEVKVLSANNK